MATVQSTVVTEKNNEEREREERKFGNLSESTKIKIESIPFDCISKSKVMTSDELATLITSAFKNVLHDLSFSIITYENTGKSLQLVLRMYFQYNNKPASDGYNKNVVLVSEGVKISEHHMINRMKALQNKVEGKKFTLNDETKLLLSDYMIGGRQLYLPTKNNNNRWDKSAYEFYDNTNSGYTPYYYNNANSVTPYICVTDLDINKIVSDIFGGTMITSTVKQGDELVNYKCKCRYNIRYIKNLPNSRSISLSVEQYDIGKVEEMNAINNMPPLKDRIYGMM